MAKRRTGWKAAVLAVVTLAAACAAPGAVGPSQGLEPVDARLLGTCPAGVHDRYTVAVLDGRVYRTWHPVVVPLDPGRPGGPTCRFAHEHGDDPRTSRADPSLPAFGYVTALAGHSEPHEGFKVAVVNAGTVNDEGRTAQVHSRAVFHMGTAGPRRFERRHHSLEFDLVAPSGHEVHVAGMADTGLAGSICERDRSLADDDPTNDVGRAVVTTRNTGCDLGSTYEIWAATLKVGGRATVVVSFAAFDPITAMDPADRTRRVPTETQYPGWYGGCDRESYHGPVYWYAREGPVTFRTDAHGRADPGGPLVQHVSNHDAIGIPMSEDQNQFKYRSGHCSPGLGPLN